MAERPLYTLYKNLKAQNYDVPDDYNKFESALTRDGKGGADNRHAIYENLKAQNFDVPNTYERFYSALFEPRSKTSSRAKGGSVPMSAADRARFSAGAAAISASAQHTMNNAGRYNRLKQRKQKQQKDFGRVNLGTHQTPYGGDANNVVKDDFAYNPETGKAGAYVSSDNKNVYSQPEAEQEQAVLDQQNNAYQEAVDTGEIPSVFDVRDKNGNYDLQENINKNGTYLTEEGARNQFDKKLADAYARKKEIEALIAEDHRQHGNPLLSYGASIGASNGRTAEQSDYSNKLATSLALVKQQIGALEAVKQYPTSSWGEDALKALDNTAFTAKTWDFGLTDFATMGQMERIKTKMDNNLPLSGSDKMLLKSKLGADAAAALEDEKMGNIYRWTKIAGQSLPFMADFFLTGGYGGITKGISRGALKFAAKRGMGKVSAAILKNTGIVAGDVIGSYAMAGTEQALKTGADIMQRHLGSLYQDEKGDYKFGTFDENGNLLHEGGESMGTALYKGLTSAMVENYTEKLFGHSYGIKKGAINFMEKHGMNASAEFFKNIGKNRFYTDLKKWMGKFGYNGYFEEVMEEEIGIPLHALLDGDNKFSDLLDTKQQLDIIGGMALSVGSMYAMGAGSRPVKGLYNRAQYYRFRNKVNVADSDAQNLMGDKWADIKDKIDNSTNEQMGGVLADILRQRDTMSKDQINAAINYGINLMKMRGYNVAKTAEMNAREITNEPTTPEEQHQEDIDNAYSEGHDADDADKHDIQLEHEDQMKTLAGLLNISEQQLSAMNDDELQSLTGQNDKLDQAIYDYQLSSARYQGVTDDAQDKIDMAANQAAQRVDMYTDKSRGSVRNATVKASGGAEDYGVYIISGNIATNEDGSINVADSDDMILFYDPTTNSVEHADALRFAELGDEVPADDVKAQAVADAKEKAIKEVAGIVDGTIDVGSQFNRKDADGLEHTYEILADYGDGTAAISIDGNVVENPYSLEDLQQLKDLEDQKRLEAAKAEREQMEKERAEQQTQETELPEETQPSLDFNQILNDNGNVVLVDVLDKDGNTKYPDSKLFLIRDTGAKAKVVEMKSDGTFVPHAVSKKNVATISSMSLDEYKQAMAETSMIEENSGAIEGDRGGIEVNDELPPVPDNVTINGDGTYSVDGAVQGGENATAPAEQTEQTPAMTLEDGTIVPMLEDGNPDFSKLTADQTAELYDSQFGDDAESVISGWVSDAKKALDKANNMTVKGKNFVEQKAAKEAKEKAIADAQAAYDSAIAIRDAYNERQLAKVEDTAEGRKELIEKARRKFSRLKSAVKDDAEAVSQLYKDVVGSLLHRLYDGTGIDVTDTIPLTAEEYVASNLGAHSLNYEGTETSKGVKQETGLSREDFAKTQLLAADGKGTTIDDLVHSLWENRPSNLESLDTQDIRNALIGVLNSGFKASEARNYIENLRIAQAENILEEQKKAADNAAFAEEQKAESEQQTETAPESEEKTEVDSSDEINDEENEQTNAPELSNEQQKAMEEGEKLGFPAFDKEGEPINEYVVELAKWAKKQGLETDPTSKLNSYADLFLMCKDGFGVITLVPDEGENINQVVYFPDNVKDFDQLWKLQEEFNAGRDLKHSSNIDSELTEGATFYDGDTAREFKEFVDKKVEKQNKVFGEQRPEEDLPFSAKENGKQQTTAERAADVEKNKVDDMKVVDNIVGEKTRKAFERLAKMMGANIQWQYSDKLGNGWVQETTDADGNVHRTIFITLDSSVTEGAQFIFGHEMTHQIKNLNPAAYNELTQLVVDTYGSDAFDKEVDETMQRYSDAGFSGRARDYYAEEVVADAVGEMIRDLNLAHTLAMKMSHPLLAAIHEILQKIKLAFFGTEYSDVTKNIIRSIEQAYVKTAGREPQQIREGDIVTDDVVNSINQEIAAAPKFSLKVYHGSGADFTEFDFDHMGEGAGSQAFGWGGYVTSSKKIGKSYAEVGQQSAESRHAYSEDTPIEAAVGSILGQDMYNKQAKTFEQKKAQAIKNAENSIASYSDMLKNSNELDEKGKKFLQKSIEKDKKELEVLRTLTEEQYKEEYIKQGRAKNLYEVDIPEDNGSNYIEFYEDATPEFKEQIKSVLANGLPSELKEMPEYKEAERKFYEENGTDESFEKSLIDDALFELERRKSNGDAYNALSVAVGDKLASKILSSLGYTGIKYPAGTIIGGAEEDDTNYVIFKPEDMKITEHAKFSLKSKPVRFEAGKKLSDEEKKEVLSTLKDAYKVNGVPYHIEETAGGKEKRVYEPTADSYVVSDITNRPLRYYITLPDGRVAHPTEVYPNISDNEVKSSATKQGLLDEEVDQIVSAAIGNMKDIADNAKAVEILNELQNLPHETHDVGYGLNHARSYNYKTGIFTSDAAQAIDYVVRRMRRKEDVPAEIPAALKKAVADSYGMVDNLIDGMINTKVGAAEIKPVGVGAFGNIYNQFRGNAKAAIEFLKKVRGGEAVGALHHKDIGDIDLVWGKEGTEHSDGYGLSKLVKYHPEVLDNLQEILNDMRVVSSSKNRVNLESETHKAGVRLTWDGERKSWLLTAFKKETSASDKRTDTAATSLEGDTALSQTEGSAAKIDNSSETAKENGEKFSLKDEKTMFGMHNISIDKLRNAIKQGGFAAPSMGVVDSKNGIYSDYGEITLIPKAEKLAKRTGKNAGTFTADAWTPTYPQVERIMNKQGEKVFNTEMNEKLGDVDNGIYSNIRESWKGYFSSGDVRDGLYWHYLFDKGMNPETIYQTGKYDNDITNEVMRISDNGNKTDYTDEEVAELIRLMNNATGKDNDVDAQREKLKARIASAEKKGNHLLAALKKKRLAELEGVENFYIAADFVNDVVRNNRKNGKVDVHDTMSVAKEKVENDKKLSADFPSWLDKKTEEYGVEEMLYNGTTPSGKPKYIPNTIDNAVKLMKKQGVAGGYTAFGSELGVFIAKNSPEVNTLAAMRNAKDKLIPFGDERHNQIKDKITKEFLELSDEIRVGSNDRYTFDDSGVSRMVELTDHKGNEKEFLKKAYNIDVSDEWMDRYNKLLDTIKKDYKVFYFETKFMRPYGLDEFEKAIVPSDTPSDVVDALKKAGIDVSSYERGNAEDRQKVTMDAISSSDNIRFSLKEEKEKIVSDAKANGTYMTAPNGEKTKLNAEQWAIVRTTNFKNWFGDWENDPEDASKVMDENGEPLVVYHGTTNDETKSVWNEKTKTYDTSHEPFTVFKREVDGLPNSGLFFNSSEDNAYEYGYNNYAVYLSAKNPLVIDCKGSLYNSIKHDGKTMDTYDWANWAEENGYDGVIFKNIKDGVDYGSMQNTTDDYVAFNSNQIKSAENNNGDFSSGNNDIRFSLKSMMTKPEGWKQANKKAIHIAEAIERDPKFSLKNLDGTLIKAGTYFSGGGLVEEGLKGIIDPVVAVEYDEKISGVYRNNFGQHIVTADVRDVDPKELVKQIDGEVEYFHASPVCKNYSQAKSNHAEVELDKETAASTAEFINAVKPKVVTIENVKGYKDSEAMKTITDALDANGYTWDADVYNAADFGGYTNRERLIVRAVRDGKLPAKPKKMARKNGWYEAVADIIPTLTEKKNGVANWMDIRLKADGIDWRNIDKPLYVMGSAYADGKIPHAFADELLPTLRTKSGDVIVMPDGKVYRAMGRVLARVSGVSDDYKMPFSENLSHTIIGNGIPTQLTEHVIAPLLTGSDPKFSIRTYHGTGASFDKFDLSHALEGEGSESFGHGVYVTNSSKIGREYAQRAKNRKMEDLYKNMRYPDGVKGDIFKRRVFGEMVNDVATGGSVASAKEFAKKRVGADVNDIQRTLENLKDREKGTEYEQNLKNRLVEYKEGLKWIDSLDEDYLTQGNANRYDVDIPDDNGSNYLDWEGTIPDSLDKQKVAEDAYKVVSNNQGFNDFKATPLNDFIAHTLKTYVNTTDVAGRVEKLKSDIKDVIENYVADDDVLALNEYLKDATPDDVLATIWYNDLVRDIKDADLGEELYRKLSTYVGDNAASKILADNGLVGIKYPAGMIHGGAKEDDYNYVIFDENNANIVGNTRFSLRYDKFEHDLNQWKKDNNLPKDAQRPTIPQRNAGESAVDFLRRVDEYRKQMALWKTAPTYEQHLLSDDTALGEFNRELQKGSVLKRIAFQDSMLAIRKAQEAIMKEVGVDRLNMAEDAYTAENRSHGKGKNEFEEYNNEFLQPLRKAYHQMKKVLGDSYDNVRVYMMAKHGLERDAQMAFKKSLEADYEDVNQRSAAYKAYKNDLDRVSNDADLEFGRVDFTTWRQKDNALRGKYSPSYMDYRYDDNGIAYDYSGLSSLFDGSDFEEAAHRLVRDVETKRLAEVQALWNATNAATKKILRDGLKAGMMSKDAYEYVKGMYSHYIPLRGWDGTTADQVWDYIGGGKGAFNQTLKTAHGRTSIADDPIAYIENMAESGILLNNKNWVKQHLMLLAQNHPTSLLTLSKAWYVKSTDANGNEEWIPATPQITSQMNSNQVKAAIDAFEQKMEQMAQTGDATQQRDGLNIAYPQTHSEEREHEVRVMKDGEEYVIYVNGDPQLAQAMNNTRAHRVREIQSGKLDRAAAWLGRKMAAAYTSLSPLFIPSNYFRDLTMTLASTAIREDGRYNYLLRKNLATSWNLGFMLRDYQNGKLREKVNNGNATPKEQMFYDFMMNGGETGFVSSLDVEDLKKKFKNDLKDLDRWKANPVKVGHTIMDGIEFLNRMIEDSNRFAVYMTSIQYGRSIDEAVNDAKDVTLNFNRKGTGEYGWQMIRNLYLFINPAVQSLQTLGALTKHHPFKFTAVTAAWLASGVLVPIVNAALMSLLGGDDDKDKYWQFSKWDRRNNAIMWIPFTNEYVKIPLAQEFRAFYGIGDMIASKMMGGELAEETWSQYAEDLLGQVVDMLPLDPTGYDGNIAVSLMPNPIRPVFELAFNVDFTGKPLFKETEYNKYDPNFTKAYVGTPDWLVRVSKMVNSIGNDYPDVQQNAIDAFGDPRYNLNNPAVVDHVLSSYLGGAYTMGSQVLGVLTKSLNDPKEIKMADIPLVSKFVSNPDDRPVTKKQGDEFWNMKENHDRAANTLSKLKKQAKVDGDYSMLERFYGSEEYKQYKQEDVKVKKYEEDKKKERADESGEEYRPHKLNAEDIYKAHTTPKDDFEDLKLKQLYTKLNGFKTSYDLLVDTAPSQSDGYYNTNKVAIDAIDEISLDKQEISELKKGFLEDGKDAYNAEDMKRIRELRKRILSVLETANKVVVANQKAKAEKK